MDLLELPVVHFHPIQFVFQVIPVVLHLLPDLVQLDLGVVLQ